MIGKTRGIRPSGEHLYPIAFALASLRQRGLRGWATFEGVPSEVLERAAREARVLTDETLSEILPINLHRAEDCMSIYIKCANTDSPKLQEAHYLLAQVAFWLLLLRSCQI
jgi:hypothetical protein